MIGGDQAPLAYAHDWMHANCVHYDHRRRAHRCAAVTNQCAGDIEEESLQKYLLNTSI